MTLDGPIAPCRSALNRSYAEGARSSDGERGGQWYPILINQGFSGGERGGFEVYRGPLEIKTRVPIWHPGVLIIAGFLKHPFDIFLSQARN